MIKNPVSQVEILERIKEQVPKFPQLAEMLSCPADYDLVLPVLGMAPHLYNMNLATHLDRTEVGPAWHIPVQVGERAGARSSIYCLEAGVEVLAGVLVAHDDIFFRYVRRETGTTPIAADGDRYTIRLVDRQGVERVRTEGELHWLDRALGMGQIRVIASKGGGQSPDWVSVIWSGIAWG